MDETFKHDNQKRSSETQKNLIFYSILKGEGASPKTAELLKRIKESEKRSSLTSK